MKKRNLVLYLSITVILISLAFSISYAFYSTTVLDGGTTSNVTASTLDIDFATTAYINNTNLFLIADTDAATKADSTQFTVSNTKSNITGVYNLTLTELTISDNLKSADFKWQLLKNGTELSTGNFLNAVTGTDFALTTANQSIAIGATDTYILRIWLSESTSDQLTLTNGTFSAKVKMTATEG